MSWLMNESPIAGGTTTHLGEGTPPLPPPPGLTSVDDERDAEGRAEKKGNEQVGGERETSGLTWTPSRPTIRKVPHLQPAQAVLSSQTEPDKTEKEGGTRGPQPAAANERRRQLHAQAAERRNTCCRRRSGERSRS